MTMVAVFPVYLATITGPSDIVRCLAVFLYFCYLVQCNSICADTLGQIQEALDQFRHHHTSIILFGSPNGLCLSIMELEHIKDIKKPWHHSSQYLALLQLTINEWQDKLATARSAFVQEGMMQGTTLAYVAMVL